MVEARYKTKKEEAKAEVLQATGVSLTLYMWTSMNMDAYLAVICHFTDGNASLNSVLLGVVKFPEAHTLQKIWPVS